MLLKKIITSDVIDRAVDLVLFPPAVNLKYPVKPSMLNLSDVSDSTWDGSLFFPCMYMISN